jgi:hypothetical protein
MIRKDQQGAQLVRRRSCDGDSDHRRVEGPQVIGPTGTVRVIMATRPVDFRKGVEGLAALVRELVQSDRLTPSAPTG